MMENTIKHIQCHMHIGLVEAILIVPEAMRHHEGHYQCNSLYKDYHDVHVHIKVPPDNSQYRKVSCKELLQEAELEEMMSRQHMTKLKHSMQDGIPGDYVENIIENQKQNIEIYNTANIKDSDDDLLLRSTVQSETNDNAIFGVYETVERISADGSTEEVLDKVIIDDTTNHSLEPDDNEFIEYTIQSGENDRTTELSAERSPTSKVFDTIPRYENTNDDDDDVEYWQTKYNLKTDKTTIQNHINNIGEQQTSDKVSISVPVTNKGIEHFNKTLTDSNQVNERSPPQAGEHVSRRHGEHTLYRKK